MKKIALVLFLTVIGLSANKIAAEQLSPTAEFSLITVSPGDELYSGFGHSALLIQDTTNQIFKLYNYGTFDFDDPNFYLKFIQGKLKYNLSVENPGELIFFSKMENRSVTQQILNLSVTQTQRLYDFLENNALPENKAYKYDFFLDNCSTRLRDALIFACGDSLNFNLDTLAQTESYRDIIDIYLVNKPYQDLGIDLGLGLPADKIPSAFQRMYMPDYLFDAFGKATNIVDGRQKKLVAGEELILKNVVVDKTVPFYEKPWVAFLFLFIIISLITYYQYKKQVNGFWLDAIFFGLLGIIGVVIFFLWFISDHAAAARNYNIIWAMPIHLFVLPFLLMKKKVKRVSAYFLIVFFTMFFTLIFWNYFPQGLNPNFIPLVMAIGMRSMYVYYRLDKTLVRWQ